MMNQNNNSRPALKQMGVRLSRYVAAATLGILLATVAVAQPQGKERRHRAEPADRLERMERLLDLASDQVEALEAIFEDQRADSQEAREAHRANGMALKEALGADDPDALTVGELMIEGKALRAAGNEDREALQTAVAEVLTDEQQAKWEGFLRGRGASRLGDRGHGGKVRPGQRGPGRRGPGQGGSGGSPRG